MNALNIVLPQGGIVFVYPKHDHTPATYTVLNLEVADIDAAVDELKSKGISVRGLRRHAPGRQGDRARQGRGIRTGHRVVPRPVRQHPFGARQLADISALRHACRGRAIAHVVRDDQLELIALVRSNRRRVKSDEGVTATPPPV